MTSKDFILIAATLNEQMRAARNAVEISKPEFRNSFLAKESAVTEMVSAFAKSLSSTNANFDRDHFIIACLKK